MTYTFKTAGNDFRQESDVPVHHIFVVRFNNIPVNVSTELGLNNLYNFALTNRTKQRIATALAGKI